MSNDNETMYLIGLNPKTQKHFVSLKTGSTIEAIEHKKANLVDFIRIPPFMDIQEKLTMLDNNLLVDQNYVNCKNNLHKNINKITPLLIDYFKNDQNIKFKTTENALYEKNAKEVKKIIDDNKIINNKDNFNSLWISLDISKYSIRLQYKDCYKSKDNGSAYIEESNYIYDFNHSTEPNFKPYKLITLKQYKKAIIDLKKFDDQLSELKSKISRLKYTFDL